MLWSNLIGTLWKVRQMMFTSWIKFTLKCNYSGSPSHMLLWLFLLQHSTSLQSHNESKMFYVVFIIIPQSHYGRHNKVMCKYTKDVSISRSTENLFWWFTLNLWLIKIVQQHSFNPNYYQFKIFCEPGDSGHTLWKVSVLWDSVSLTECIAAYLAVELEEKLAELEGLQGKWQFSTKATSSTGYVENKRMGSATRSKANKTVFHTVLLIHLWLEWSKTAVAVYYRVHASWGQ